MKTRSWLDRKLSFGLPVEMLPFIPEHLDGTAIRQKLRGISEVGLSTCFNDKFSVKQHIGHLAEADEVNDKRLDKIICGVSQFSSAVFEPMDLYKFNLFKSLLYE